MSDSQKSIFRRRLRVVLLAVLLISILITGIVDYLGLPNKPGFSISAIFMAFFTVPLTWILFPVNFVVLSILASILVYHTWMMGQKEDKIGRDFSHSGNGDPYGDAHFEEPHEYVNVAQIRPKELCKGKILGQLTDVDGEECIDFNPFDGRTNQHMFVVAMSGGGKTYNFTKPYLFQALKQRHSLLVTDPDGGLFRDCAGLFRDNGYVVRQLALKNLNISDGWDCLASLKGENMLTNVQLFARAVIANMGNKEDIHSSAANSLLCALILKVLLGPEYPEEKKNIRSVYELLQDPAGYSHLENVFDKNNLKDEEMPCLAPFLAFKQASTNLAANIATTLANGLQVLQNKQLCDVLSADDIDLTLPGLQPCIYFCQFPDTHDTYKFVVSLFFTMLIISLTDYADNNTENGALPVTVDFLLDEFISIGVIPNWSALISVLRKRNINAVMIAQSIPQFQQLYDKSWANILNNCGTIITHGINESDETAKWLSERIGETSIEIESIRRNEIVGRKAIIMAQNTTGVGRRALMTPSEICKIDENHGLVIFARHNPIYCRTTPNVIFPEAKLLYKTRPADLLNFSDKTGRSRLRACEKEYIEKYWQTHQLRPDFHLSDLSDALYTQQPAGPIEMLLQLLTDDVKQIWHKLHKDKAHSLPQDDAGVSQRAPKEKSESDYLSIKLAEKGAFQAFYEDWLRTHPAGEENETGGLPKTIRVDQETGEVLSGNAYPDMGSVKQKPIHTHFGSNHDLMGADSTEPPADRGDSKGDRRYSTILDDQEVFISAAKDKRPKAERTGRREKDRDKESKKQKEVKDHGTASADQKQPAPAESFAPITTAQANPLDSAEQPVVKKKKPMPMVK